MAGDIEAQDTYLSSPDPRAGDTQEFPADTDCQSLVLGHWIARGQWITSLNPLSFFCSPGLVVLPRIL